MKKIFKSYSFNIFVIVLFTFLAMWLTLKDSYTEVITTLKKVNIGYLFLIVFIVILIQYVIGVILTLLTKLSNPHYKYSYGFINALVASFFHGITPSASGGQVAQVYVFKKQGVPITDSASILWMDFIIYQSTMCGTVLILLLLRFNYFYMKYSQFYFIVLLGFLLNASIIVGLWAVARFPKVYTWISTQGIEIGCKLHIIKNREKTLDNLKKQLAKFNAETTKLKNHKPLILKCFILNCIRCSLYYSLPYFVFLALGFNLSFANIVDCMALTSFVSMVTGFIPIPGASGGTEAIYVLMFSTLLGLNAAKSTMVLWRFMTYYFIMIIGGLTFIYVKLQRGLDMFTKEVE